MTSIDSLSTLDKYFTYYLLFSTISINKNKCLDDFNEYLPVNMQSDDLIQIETYFTSFDESFFYVLKQEIFYFKISILCFQNSI
jgi:hypothetical protein